MEDERNKIGQLRNNEYYLMQETFDALHKKSVRGDIFYNLIKYIENPKNIKLAYRNIKSNKGSKAKSVSGKNITYIANMKLGKYLNKVKDGIQNYRPQKIRRVGIPKSNGKIRYLGIKEPLDKIIEQAIYQVLSPIITAKFHNNSNGFIQGRSQERAIAQMTNYIIKGKLYYVVDIDIKGFFDNINHGKLIKQLYTLGIRDKNLLTIISKMLKAEVEGKGIPEKGTPQGGILSPLLANVVLNELDWWLDSKKNKKIRFIRFADDFKILCPTYQVASDMLGKTKKWLENRLQLEVSEEKTKIVNLKKTNSEYLGFRFKVKKKGNKMIIVSHMSEKAKEKAKKELKKQVRIIKKCKYNPKKCAEEVDKYNSKVIGIHNYYELASRISQDLNKIGCIISKYIHRNLKDKIMPSSKEILGNGIIEKYGEADKLYYIRGKPIAPIEKISTKPAKYIGNVKNYYDEKSRNKFHKEVKIPNMYNIDILLKNQQLNEAVEFNDNVISKFCGQLGKYAITNQLIINANNAKAIKIKKLPFNNKYDNILIVDGRVAFLLEVERTEENLIDIQDKKVGLKSEKLDKINKIRMERNLRPI